MTASHNLINPSQILKAMGPLPSIADAPSLEIAQNGMRAMSDNMLATNSPYYSGISKEIVTIPVRDGMAIGAIVYKRTQPTKASPLIVLYHGGGWVLGFPEAEEYTALIAVREFGAVVVSVDYRMAPSHPFPVAIEDSWDALKWVCTTFLCSLHNPCTTNSSPTTARSQCVNARSRSNPRFPHRW